MTTERLLKTSEYAQLRGIQPQSARRERWEGSGPRFVKIGRRVYYRQSDVEEYMRTLPSFQSTAEASAGPQPAA